MYQDGLKKFKCDNNPDYRRVAAGSTSIYNNAMVFFVCPSFLRCDDLQRLLSDFRISNLYLPPWVMYTDYDSREDFKFWGRIFKEKRPFP